MQIETYERKPFSVEAVQVTFENVHEVAAWCKGTVITQKIKMLGVDTDVPAVQFEGQGENRGKTFVASLNFYVVELNGNFRIYKPAAFHSTFEKPVEIEHLIEGPDVEDLEVTPETKAEWAQDDNSAVA